MIRMNKTVKFISMLLLVSLLVSTLISRSGAEEVATSEPPSVLKAKLLAIMNEQPSGIKIKDLINRGADVKVVDNYNKTLLIKAVGVNYNSTQQQIDVIKTLIAAGVDLDAKDSLGESALMKAKLLKKDAFVKELELAGAKLSEEDNKYIEDKIKRLADEAEQAKLKCEAEELAAKIKADLKKQEDAIAAEQAERAKKLEEERNAPKAPAEVAPPAPATPPATP